MISAGFETGVDGGTIATGDAGDADAWNTVTVPAGGAAVYDNDHVHRGALAAKLSRGTTGATILIWSTAYGTQTDHYGRTYVYITANPASTIGFIQFRDSGSGGIACSLRLKTDGKIELLDTANNILATSTDAVPLDQWVRIEWHVVHSTTVGSFEVQVFHDADSATETETVSFSGTNTLASSDSVRWQVNNANNFSIWLDDIVAAHTVYPGPSLYDVTGTRAAATAAAQPGTPTISVTGARAASTAAVQAGTVAHDFIFDGARASATAAAQPGTLIFSTEVRGVRAEASAEAQAGFRAVFATVTGSRANATSIGLGGQPTIVEIRVQPSPVQTPNRSHRTRRWSD